MREMQIRQTVKLGKLAEKCCMIETSVSKEGSGVFLRNRDILECLRLCSFHNVNSLAIVPLFEDLSTMIRNNLPSCN